MRIQNQFIGNLPRWVVLCILACGVAFVPNSNAQNEQTIEAIGQLYEKWAEQRDFLKCDDEKKPSSCRPEGELANRIGISQSKYIKLTKQLLNRRAEVEEYLLDQLESNRYPRQIKTFLHIAGSDFPQLEKLLVENLRKGSSQNDSAAVLLEYFIGSEYSKQWLVEFSTIDPSNKEKWMLSHRMLEKALAKPPCHPTVVDYAVTVHPPLTSECEPQVVLNAISPKLSKTISRNYQELLVDSLAKIWLQSKEARASIEDLLGSIPMAQSYLFCKILRESPKLGDDRYDLDPESILQWVRLMGKADSRLHFEYSRANGCEDFATSLFTLNPEVQSDEGFQAGAYNILFRQRLSPKTPGNDSLKNAWITWILKQTNPTAASRIHRLELLQALGTSYWRHYDLLNFAPDDSYQSRLISSILEELRAAETKQHEDVIKKMLRGAHEFRPKSRALLFSHIINEELRMKVIADNITKLAGSMPLYAMATDMKYLMAIYNKLSKAHKKSLVESATTNIRDNVNSQNKYFSNAMALLFDYADSNWSIYRLKKALDYAVENNLFESVLFLNMLGGFLSAHDVEGTREDAAEAIEKATEEIRANNPKIQEAIERMKGIVKYDSDYIFE